MDAQQLDSLLQSKVNRAHSIKRILLVAVVVLCFLAIGGGGIYYYLANRELPEEPDEPTFAATDSVEPSTDTQQELLSTSDSADTDSEPTVPNTAEMNTDTPTATPEADGLTSNEAQSDECYTHSLQMVWFGELRNMMPEELNISVLHKGEPVKEFILTSDDGWCYTWMDSYPADELTLQGDFPQGVTSAFSVSGQNFTVTGINSDPSVTANADDSEAEEQLAKRELPRTGMIWPIELFLIGLALVMAGVFSKKALRSKE